MKAPLMGVALLSTFALAACASMDEQSAATPAASAASSARADQAYMARVEQLARRRGIEVIWLNAPTVASADPGGDD